MPSVMTDQRVNDMFSRMIAGRVPAIRALKTATKTTGLRYWMARVLEECERVAAILRAIRLQVETDKA